MNDKKLLKHLVILMFFLFIANSVILKLNLFSLIWYLDIAMHFLGGFWVGLFFLYVFLRHATFSFTTYLIIKVLLASLIIGLLWELYEFLLNIISHTSFDPHDTISDLFFDLAGSLGSVVYFLRFIMIVPKNKLQLENE